MKSKNSLYWCLLLGLFLSCASTSQLSQNETVKIVLNNGDKISAKIVDVGRDQIVFRAKSRQQAYNYGEIIDVQKVKGIQLKDGRLLSVTEYQDYRNGQLSKRNSRRKEPVKLAKNNKATNLGSNEDLQYEELKKKPISDMNDNEYNYFMMMKEKELREKSERERRKAVRDSIRAAQREIGLRASGRKKPQRKSAHSALKGLTDSIVSAGLAPEYIMFLQNKRQSGEKLTPVENEMFSLLENNSKWQEKIDDLRYINHVAEKAMTRAFLYNPDDLQTKVGLTFNPDLDLDYADLMGQLHRMTGNKVKMSDYRILIDVFGETGSKAIKEILENYQTWQFAVQQNSQTEK